LGRGARANKLAPGQVSNRKRDRESASSGPFWGFNPGTAGQNPGKWQPGGKEATMEKEEREKLPWGASKDVITESSEIMADSQEDWGGRTEKQEKKDYGWGPNKRRVRNYEMLKIAKTDNRRRVNYKGSNRLNIIWSSRVSS